MPEKLLKSISPSRKYKEAFENVTPTSAINVSLQNTSLDSSKSSARRAFYDVTDMPCRETEINELENFIMDHLKFESSGSLYVSGLPGTGKTAALNQVTANMKVKKNYHIVFVNCTAVRSSGSVYQRIFEQLKIKSAAKTEKGALAAIEKYLSRKHKMVLLILDEIDQLECKFQSVLYKLFELPSKKNARLVLIGIANSVDLTDRMLPRLYAEVQCRPRLLHFAPYTKDQIATILKHRLTQVGEIELFAPGALELISAKVAGQSGDVRRALDLGRRVLEISKTPSLRISNELNLSGDVITKPRKSQRQLFSDEDDSPRISTRSPIKPRKLWELGEDKSFDTSPTKTSVLEENIQRTPVKYSSINDLKTDVANTKITPRKSPRKRGLFDEGSPMPTMSSSRKSTQKENCFLSPSPKNSPLAKNLFSPGKRRATEEVDNPSLCKEMRDAVTNSPLRRMSPRKKTLLFSPPKKNLFTETFAVHARDVLQVVNDMYGTARKLKTEESAFPLHQKLVICSLMLILNKSKNKDVNVGRLHQVYTRVCTKRGITAVDQSGFIFLCRQVEMAGAVTVGKGPPRLAKITLLWDEIEVAHSLQDSSLLAAILSDTASLSK